MGHPLLVKQPPLGRRPARRPPRGLGLSCFRIQVGEDLLDDLGILDARNDPHCSAADRTGLDVDAENPLEALRPSHRGATFRLCRRLRIRGRGTLTAPAPLGRRHPRAVFAVRCKHPMKASEVDPRLGHQGRQPCDEIQRLKDDVGRTVAVWCLQLVSNVAIWGERQALFGDRRPADVPAQPFELLVFIRARRDAGVQ